MVSSRCFIATLCTGSLLLSVGCGSKPEPPPSPPPTEAASSSVEPSPAEPTAKKAGADVPPRVEPQKPSPESKPTTPKVAVDESLRKAASQLARKEGSAWKIDDAARAKLDELGPDATEKLVPLLGGSSADARRGAAYYLLGRFDANNDALVNGFINLINDEDRTTRGIALAAIPKFKPAQKKSAAPQLAKLLETTVDDDQQRTTAVRLLGEIGPEAASLLPQLAGAAANDKSPKVRSAALLAISHIASPADAVPIFQKALSDQEPTVRTMALQRLRALGREAAPAVDDLAKLLEEKDEKTRNTAAETLVRIGSKSIPALEAKLESSSATTREVAVYALGKMGGVAAPALPALKKRLDDSDPKVKKLAEAVVAHIESL